MALLNRKVDYAILVLSHLYRHPGGGAARAIAERYNLSRGFVANILKELCHEGYVTSHRGVKGGYALAAGATQLTLAELIETLDETFRLAECNHADGADCAVFGTCTMKEPISAVHNKIMDVLRGVTLGELFGENDRPTGLPVLELIGK
jgi:Rrf2 family protein